MNSSNNIIPLYTVKDFCALQPWPTIGALQWMIFNGEQNGLLKSRAIIRFSNTNKRGRILIDAEKFWNWVRGNEPA